MNRIIPLFLVLSIVLLGCAGGTDKEPPAEDPDITGVWEMTAMYNFDENGDSIEVYWGDHRQVKIYTDGYVMWSRTVPEDSAQWYGWGGYAVENGMLMEWIEYGSHAFMPWIDPMDPFEHKLKVSGNTYIQTAYDSLGNPTASEHYVLISEDSEVGDENVDESLEGVWEMTKLESLQDGELAEVDRTGYRQIKMYHNGYVMWSQHVPMDSTQWFGFGRYTSEGGILTEYMQYGSHSFMPFIGDEPFVMDLRYDGNDIYWQISKDEEGNQNTIEYYKRLGEHAMAEEEPMLE